MQGIRSLVVAAVACLAMIAPVVGSAAVAGGVGPAVGGAPAVADETVEFGGVPVGDSTTLEYTLENPYDEPINATSYSLSGPDADAFEVVEPQPPVEVPAADVRDVVVRFTPDHAGTHNATLSVELRGAVNRTVEVALTGSGQVPQAVLGRPAIDFGSHPVGTETVRSVSVTNDGEAPLTLSSFAFAGPAADAYDVVGPAPDTTIAPGESVAVEVAYVPGEAGADPATLEIGTNDPERPTLSVELDGEGVTADVRVDPVRVSFGGVSVGASDTTEVTIENAGDAPAQITGLAIEGEDAGAFAVDATGGFTLDPGEQRTVTVTFAPGRADRLRARLVVETDGGGEPIGVTLEGVGTEPDIRVSTRSLNFGNVTVGETVERTVTVENVGGEPLRVDGATLVGPDSGAFSITGGFPTTLAPGESRTVTVRFTPESGGTKSAYLRISSDDPDADTVSVWLSNSNTVVEVETDETDNETTVNVSVQNASAGDSVPVNVTSEGSQAQNASVDSINVTVNRDGDFSLNVTQRPDPDPTAPAFELADGTQSVGFISVEHSLPESAVGEVRFTVRVKRATLAAKNASPEDVSLYRFHGGRWVELETRIVEETERYVVLEAVSPGLSDFTTGVKQPKFDVTQANVEVTEITEGETVAVNVRITNTGGADGRFTAQLILNGEVIEERTVTVATNGTRQLTFEHEFSQPGEYEVRINDEPADQIVVQESQVATDTNADQDAPTPSGDSLPVALLAVAGVLIVLVGAFGARRLFGGGDGEPGGSEAAAESGSDEGAESGTTTAQSDTGGPLRDARPDERPADDSPTDDASGDDPATDDSSGDDPAMDDSSENDSPVNDSSGDDPAGDGSDSGEE